MARKRPAARERTRPSPRTSAAGAKCCSHLSPGLLALRVADELLGLPRTPLNACPRRSLDRRRHARQDIGHQCGRHGSDEQRAARFQYNRAHLVAQHDAPGDTSRASCRHALLPAHDTSRPAAGAWPQPGAVGMSPGLMPARNSAEVYLPSPAEGSRLRVFVAPRLGRVRIDRLLLSLDLLLR